MASKKKRAATKSRSAAKKRSRPQAKKRSRVTAKSATKSGSASKKKAGKPMKKAASRPKPPVAASQPKSPMQRISSVAVQVVQQAQSAMSEGVEALREVGGNLADRVTERVTGQ